MSKDLSIFELSPHAEHRHLVEQSAVLILNQLCEIDYPDLERVLQQIELIDGNASIAAETEGIVHGAAVLAVPSGHDSEQASIQEIAVDLEYRNQGIGRRLVGYMEALARQANLSHIQATSMKHSRGFYTALGFQPDDGASFVKDLRRV